MITSPTTESLILDCCRELVEEVLPALDDEVVQAHLQMIDAVLRATAVRAGHEIAWMHEETAQMWTFVRAVAAATPGASGLGDVIACYAPEHAKSLHLQDVVAAYRQAGEAFSIALEYARELPEYEQRPALLQAVEQILDARVEHERAIRGEWSAQAGR